MIKPARLPRVRDRMVALLSDPGSALRRNAVIDGEYGLALDIAARHLATGDLYWVSSDMAALATAAARELDTVRWTTADRPAATGLMVMDGGVGWLSGPRATTRSMRSAGAQTPGACCCPCGWLASASTTTSPAAAAPIQSRSRN